MLNKIKIARCDVYLLLNHIWPSFLLKSFKAINQVVINHQSFIKDAISAAIASGVNPSSR